MKHHLKVYNIALLVTCLLSILTFVAVAQKRPKKLFAVMDVIIEDTSLLHHPTLRFDMTKIDLKVYPLANSVTYEQVLAQRKTRIKIPLNTALDYGQIGF